MGRRNPDRWSPTDWRRGHETVAQMLEAGWEVTTKSGRCGVEQIATLRLIARLKGPTFSLWNKRTPCKVVRCGGALSFRARPHGVYEAFELFSADPDSWPPRP